LEFINIYTLFMRGFFYFENVGKIKKKHLKTPKNVTRIKNVQSFYIYERMFSAYDAHVLVT